MCFNSRAAILGSIAILVLSGCSDPPIAAEAVRPVRAIKLGDLKAIESREFPGRATAKDEVDLSFQVAGPLISLPVDVGSGVKKGDLVAAIDSRDFQAALDTAEGNLQRAQANLLAMERGARPEEIEQLKASVSEAEATYQQSVAENERILKLRKSGASSQSDVDLSLARTQRNLAQLKKAKEDLNIGTTGARPEDLEAKRAEVRALQGTVANAKNQLDYATLVAPFDGRVVALYVDNFQSIQAKQAIARLVDVSKIEITIQIPENLIALVPNVTSAICRFDALTGREFPGKITKVGSEASLTTRTYPVTVELEQPGDVEILPGMAASVRADPESISDGPVAQLTVPPSAIFTSGDDAESYVWIVEGKKVVRRAVKAGQLTAVGRVIESGLKPGDWVVTAGVNSLRESQPVTILQEGKR